MSQKIKHPFRKKWGQNFLINNSIIEQIINSLELKTSDNILEIGPGDGALTNKLITKISHLYGVEIDPLLIKKLNIESKDKTPF